MNPDTLGIISNHFDLKAYLRPLLVLLALLAVFVLARTDRVFMTAPEHEFTAADIVAGDGPFSMQKVRSLFPDADHLTDSEQPGHFDVHDADGQPLGALIYGPPREAEIIGYAGRVPFLIALDPQERIRAVKMLPNRETPTYARRVSDRLADAWNGLSPAEAQTESVDAVSGATATSQALIRGVRKSMRVFSPAAVEPENEEAVFNGTIISHLLVLWFLFIVLGVFSLPVRPSTRAKNFIRILSVLIPGLLAGTMLSLSLLGSWAHRAFTWRAHWLLLILAAVAVLFSLIQGKNLYCNHFCPFGAGQDLAATLTRHKWPLSQNVRLIMRAVQVLLLVFAFIVVVADMRFDLSMLEPFSAFRWEHATWASRTLALVFLLLAFKIPRPWCQICPTGGVIAGLRKKSSRTGRNHDQ